MAEFAGKIAQDIRTTFESLPPDVQQASRIGFVFLRGETDDEKYVIVKPRGVADAVSALAGAAKPEYMKGGGGAARPVLDAVFMAHHLYPWAAGADTGRRIVIAVLADDARPATLGMLHNGVPPGIEAASIARDLSADGIPVISIQAGPNAGSNLVPVLSALAEGSGGAFVGWGTGGGHDVSWVKA
jgi:hypothetical protein